jgi:hypothetical protein
VLLVLALDVAPRFGECTSDSECTAVQSTSCCGECCPEPSVISVKEAKEARSRCAKKDCKKPDCSAVKCAPRQDLGTIVPTCESGQCVAKYIAPMAPRPAPRPVSDVECVRDSDCTMQPLVSCCGQCCPSPPAAHSKKAVEERNHHCAIVDCAAPHCTDIACEPVTESPSDFEAVCRASRCVAVHIPKAECNKDSDCRVDYPAIEENAACRSSPCGCCPSTNPVAVPVTTPQKHRPPPAPPPRPLTKKDGKGVQFGLSPGETPPPPQCSPCPAQEPAHAICSEHHCVLDRPHAL